MLKMVLFTEYNNEPNEKTLNLKYVIMSGFQSTKMFLLKDTVQTGVKKSLLLKKIKNNVPWSYVISDLNEEEIVGTFYEKELQKTNQKEFRIDKVIKREGNTLYVNWKGYNKSFHSWINKKDLLK